MPEQDSDFFGRLGKGLPLRKKIVKDDMPVSDNVESASIISVDETTNNRMWSVSGDYRWPAAPTKSSLEAGYYKFTHVSNIGYCLEKANISTDSLIALPDTAFEVIDREFRDFWRLKQRFIDRGMIHKRGFMLYGPPGSGKTAIFMQLRAAIIEAGGLVVQIDNPQVAAICLSFIRKIEPDRPILALIEDIDALIEQYNENAFLSLLDGETQVDNIVYIASTNYPERLDKRFVDRPSRFDSIMYVGMPSAKARKMFFQTKEPGIQGEELNKWVRESEGFSIAHLRELIILVKVFDHSFESSIARLEAMRVKPNSEHGPDRMKFGIVA